MIADGARESRPARAMLSARRVSLDSTVTVQARSQWHFVSTKQKRPARQPGVQTADEPHVFVSVGFCLSGIR
ncbi:hypothetical protein ACGYXG_29385, partial [Burkholderia pseudomallei]